jgi:hypothetical protein
MKMHAVLQHAIAPFCVIGVLTVPVLASADGIHVRGNATVRGTNNVQTVVAIGRKSEAIGEVGAASGNVRVGRNLKATGRNRTQTVIALGSRSDAYAGTGTVSGRVNVGGSIKVHGSTGHQVAIDIGVPDFGLFSFSCVGCVTSR